MDGLNAIQYILTNNIEGDIVECGVYQGDFEYIWIQELIKHNKVRDIYMYDTFKGLVEPSEHDYTCKDSKLYSMNSIDVHNSWKNQIIDKNTNNWCFAPLDFVKKRLESIGYPQDKLHYIVGDVMETLKDKTNIPKKISILRLDTDWYESSKYELEQMYDNVVTGGIIIFDDYYHWDGQRRAVDDYFESINIKYDFIDLNNDKTGAIIKK